MISSIMATKLPMIKQHILIVGCLKFIAIYHNRKIM